MFFLKTRDIRCEPTAEGLPDADYSQGWVEEYATLIASDNHKSYFKYRVLERERDRVTPLNNLERVPGPWDWLRPPLYKEHM